MRRRDVLGLIAGAALPWPYPTRASQALLDELGRLHRPDPVPLGQDAGARARRRPQRSDVDPGLRAPRRRRERTARRRHAVQDRIDHQSVHRPASREPRRGRRGQPGRSADQIRSRVYRADVGGRAANSAYRSRHPFGRAAARSPARARAAGRSVRQRHARRLRRLAQGEPAHVYARNVDFLFELRL